MRYVNDIQRWKYPRIPLSQQLVVTSILSTLWVETRMCYEKAPLNGFWASNTNRDAMLYLYNMRAC